MSIAEARQSRLLTIDDSPWVHRLLRGRLRHERLEMHSAMTGVQGLEVARTLLPDVILLDFDLPDIDGFQVMERLKSDTATNNIPVIALSSETATGYKVRAFDLGAHDYVIKPFEVAELRARIRSAVRLRQMIRMLDERARIDGLTQLWNRTYFDTCLNDEVKLALRHGHPLSLLVCDLDEFKMLNDSYGHPYGDYVLESLARMLRSGRSGDVACRYGGEEFAIIMPNTTAEEARLVGDRLRRGLRAHTWEGQPDLQVTASFGVSDLIRSPELTAEALLASADAALYEAKARGRDQVVLAPDPSLTSMHAS